MYNDADWAFCDLSKSADSNYVKTFDSTDFPVYTGAYNSVKILSEYVYTYLQLSNLSENIVLLRALHRYCANAVTKSTTDYTEIPTVKAFSTLMNHTECGKFKHNWYKEVKHTKHMLKHDLIVCPSYKNTSVQYVDNGETVHILNSVPHDVTNITATDTDELEVEIVRFILVLSIFNFVLSISALAAT